MPLFKINGERNSGTNFLSKILGINGFPCFIHKRDGRKFTYWKHGVPDDGCKKLDEKVVDLFIFRDLSTWLTSMFKNPYDLNVKKFNQDFNLFLNTKQEADNFWRGSNNEAVNKDDNGKTIFEIRYYKFNKIMDYKKRNKDVVLINLEFIQNEQNLSKLLDFLRNKYMPELEVDYKLKIKHTKDGSNRKNRDDHRNLISEHRHTIDSNKNEEVEEFIDNLTFI